MFQPKKRKDHAGDGDDTGDLTLDFAWIVFMGVQMGFTEKEISRMYLSKWDELFDQFKKYHNFKMQRGLFKAQKVASLLDL